MVDPAAESVKVFVREGIARPAPCSLSLRDGDALTTQLLPGLEIALAALFAE